MANVITVSALNRYVKTLLDRDPVLTDIALRGEISNFTNHFRTGHFYFSLKDDACSVKAVMFRSDAQRVPFAPQNGMRVIVRCRVSLFERDGAFQVYVDEMFPDGIGAMRLAFEQLKEKLNTEGLFDPEHKKMLPAMPRCVGLVTSKTGAAIQDILNVTKRRYPMAHFLLCPVNVQGQEAAPGIVQAIRRLDADRRVDVIIVARGGGSREDLWVFNDERIARAAYACQTPLVSAVGHEIDFSILDFVADLRAPTPSAAAELVMPDLTAACSAARRTFSAIRRQMQNRLVLCYNRKERFAHASELAQAKEKPARLAAEVEQSRREAADSIKRRFREAQARTAYNAQLAASLNPYGVLARGYGMIRVHGRTIGSAAAVRAGGEIHVQMHDGSLQCAVKRVFLDTERENHEKRDDI